MKVMTANDRETTVARPITTGVVYRRNPRQLYYDLTAETGI
jgi:hypothetical protein